MRRMPQCFWPWTRWLWTPIRESCGERCDSIWLATFVFHVDWSLERLGFPTNGTTSSVFGRSARFHPTDVPVTSGTVLPFSLPPRPLAALSS